MGNSNPKEESLEDDEADTAKQQINSKEEEYFSPQKPSATSWKYQTEDLDISDDVDLSDNAAADEDDELNGTKNKKKKDNDADDDNNNEAEEIFDDADTNDIVIVSSSNDICINSDNILSAVLLSSPIKLIDESANNESCSLAVEQSSNNHQIEKDKQQIEIEDVLLLNQDCQHKSNSNAPLAQQELLNLSFNSELNNSSFKIENLFQKNETIDENKSIEAEAEVEVEEEEDKENVMPNKNKNLFSKLLNELAHNNLIEYRFEFNNNDPHTTTHIDEIQITGSFNNWSEYLSMAKDVDHENCWYKVLYLAPGEYEYKFVINKTEWKCDSTKPTRDINNFVIIK